MLLCTQLGVSQGEGVDVVTAGDRGLLLKGCSVRLIAIPSSEPRGILDQEVEVTLISTFHGIEKMLFLLF